MSYLAPVLRLILGVAEVMLISGVTLFLQQYMQQLPQLVDRAMSLIQQIQQPFPANVIPVSIQPTPFDMLFRIEDYLIDANSGYVDMTGPIDISKYRLKTISIVTDYDAPVVIEVSDDGVVWKEYYSFTASANKLSSYSFEEDFKYLRIKVANNTTKPHMVIELYVKGRP